jgi:hypothetical protein
MKGNFNMETQTQWIARRARERSTVIEEDEILDAYRHNAAWENYPTENLTVRVITSRYDCGGYIFSNEDIVATWDARASKLGRQIHVGLWFNFNE